MNLLPPIDHLVLPDELTLTPDEELRLLDDRTRHTRWWAAPHRTTDPPAHASQGQFDQPWPRPWTTLNDPDRDDMHGIMIAIPPASGVRGMLIFVNPTDETRLWWQGSSLGEVPITIGAERTDGTYRAVIHALHAYPPIDGQDHVRFVIADNPGPAWQAWTTAKGPEL